MMAGSRTRRKDEMRLAECMIGNGTDGKSDMNAVVARGMGRKVNRVRCRGGKGI